LTVDAPSSHHFMKLFKKQEPLSQSQVASVTAKLVMDNFLLLRVKLTDKNCHFTGWL